jgi:hypothetical protein
LSRGRLGELCERVLDRLVAAHPLPVSLREGLAEISTGARLDVSAVATATHPGQPELANDPNVA